MAATRREQRHQKARDLMLYELDTVMMSMHSESERHDLLDSLIEDLTNRRGEIDRDRDDRRFARRMERS